METHKLLTKILSFSMLHELLPKSAKIILGLSGGPDSVLLLNFLSDLHHQGRISLVACHLDHEWRSNSSSDVAFCKQITKKLKIPFVTKKISQFPFTFTYNGSKEELGRKARRHFLQTVAQEYDADLIALAHHANDQQETFLFRLMRGTSLSGLVGMRPKAGNYIRPLLSIYKQEILSYLTAHNIPYLNDPSNESDTFLRNRIRNKVIPILQQCDPRFDKNFASTLERLQATESFLQELTLHTFATVARKENGTMLLSIDELLTLHPVMRYRILSHWFAQEKISFTPSQSFFDELLRFLSNQKSKTHHLHEKWLVKKEARSMWVEKLS